MPMIATTIINSIRVKPCWMERFMRKLRSSLKGRPKPPFDFVVKGDYVRHEPGRNLDVMVPGTHFHWYTCWPMLAAAVIAAPAEVCGVRTTVLPSMPASPTPCAVTVTWPSALVATEATYFVVAL